MFRMADCFNQFQLSILRQTKQMILYFYAVKILALFLSIYFFAGSLMPGSDWDELPKLADLIEHFQHHEESSQGKITFADFIYLHYSSESSHPQEDGCSLPFQHPYACAFLAVIPQFDFRIAPIVHFPDQPVLHVTKETRDHVSAVFQPPQLG
jgi:hypothetical protein